MKRHFIAAALAAVTATSLFAQADKPVATINGETVTRAELDHLWERIGERMQQQYEKSGGGKAGLLENYIGKRLILQQAMNMGFADLKPGMKLDLDTESKMFDRYVREVLAASVVPESAIREFYDQNPGDFTHKDQARVHIIHVSSTTRPESDAQKIIGDVMSDLMAYRTSPKQLQAAFEAAARQYSEHPSAKSGGNLGWVDRGALDPALDDAAFTMPTGVLSGIIEDHGHLHLLLVDARRDAGKESFDEAKKQIRDYLLAKNARQVMEKLNTTTADLRSRGKVTVFAENLK